MKAYLKENWWVYAGAVVICFVMINFFQHPGPLTMEQMFK